MAVQPFLTGTYARNIYLSGARTFSGIPAEYHTPVKQYAADYFTRGQIDEALSRGYITDQEYLETVALITHEVIIPTSAPNK